MAACGRKTKLSIQERLMRTFVISAAREKNRQWSMCCGVDTFKECRGTTGRGVQKIPLSALPITIKHGIAPAMMPDPEKTFWGASAQHSQRSQSLC